MSKLYYLNKNYRSLKQSHNVETPRNIWCCLPLSLNNTLYKIQQQQGFQQVYDSLWAYTCSDYEWLGNLWSYKSAWGRLCWLIRALMLTYKGAYTDSLTHHLSEHLCQYFMLTKHSHPKFWYDPCNCLSDVVVLLISYWL